MAYSIFFGVLLTPFLVIYIVDNQYFLSADTVKLTLLSCVVAVVTSFIIHVLHSGYLYFIAFVFDVEIKILVSLQRVVINFQIIMTKKSAGGKFFEGLDNAVKALYLNVDKLAEVEKINSSSQKKIFKKMRQFNKNELKNIFNIYSLSTILFIASCVFQDIIFQNIQMRYILNYLVSITLSVFIINIKAIPYLFRSVFNILWNTTKFLISLVESVYQSYKIDKVIKK